MHCAFHIRHFHEQDYTQVVELWEATHLGSPTRGDDLAVIQRTLSHGGFFLVMEDSDSRELLGTSWLTNDGRRLYLHHFGIAPAKQGQGLGTALLRESLRHAVAIGLQVKLEVHENNASAIALYRGMGFSPLGPYDGYIIRDLQGLVL